MTKEHIIRPTDAREYIDFQFDGLATTLEQFDFNTMAKIVRATQAIFNKTNPDSHVEAEPDYTLFNTTKTDS